MFLMLQYTSALLWPGPDRESGLQALWVEGWPTFFLHFSNMHLEFTV